MPTYISLINWTDQGIRTFKDSVKRAEAAAEAAKRMGGSLPHIYWTVGQYDLVAISEFPDDESATAFLLALGAQGNIRTSTMMARSAEEITEIISKAS